MTDEMQLAGFIAAVRTSRFESREFQTPSPRMLIAVQDSLALARLIIKIAEREERRRASSLRSAEHLQNIRQVLETADVVPEDTVLPGDVDK